MHVVEPRVSVGGGVRSTLTLASQLAGDRFSNNVAVFGFWRGAVVPAAGPRVTCIPATEVNPLGLRFIGEFKKAIEDVKPHVVHVMGLYTALLAILLRCVYGYRFKIIVTVHRATDKIRYRVVGRALARFISRCIDHTIFLTEYQKAHYANSVKFAPRDTTILPNIVVKRTVPAGELAAARRELLNETNARHLIVYVGRLMPSKRIDMFIEAVAEVRRDGLDVGGVIVGAGSAEHLEMLHAMTDRLGAGSFIHFTGFVNNPELYVAAADCILLPTETEALPNVLIESYALGKPVVVSSIPQLRSLTASGHNCLVVQRHESGEYARAVMRLLRDEDLYKTISAGARRTCIESYEPDRIARRYCDVYERVCGE